MGVIMYRLSVSGRVLPYFDVHGTGLTLTFASVSSVEVVILNSSKKCDAHTTQTKIYCWYQVQCSNMVMNPSFPGPGDNPHALQYWRKY